MRRKRSGFAWVSMMDLLFGMFGALVVLTMIISLKLGSFSGIERRPFHALTVELATADANLAEALIRMHIALHVFTPQKGAADVGASACVLAARLDDVKKCLNDIVPRKNGVRMVEFATATGRGPQGNGAVLRATMLINEPREIGALHRIVVRPVLADIAALLDTPDPIDDEDALSLRISVKTGSAFWEPRPFKRTVSELLARAERMPVNQNALIGADLLPATPEICAVPQSATDCTNAKLLIGGGRLVFSW